MKHLSLETSTVSDETLSEDLYHGNKRVGRKETQSEIWMDFQIP